LASGPPADNVERLCALVEDRLEPPDGPQVAFTGRGRLDAEHGRRLDVVQFLEVAQHHDLAVDRVHAVERLLQPEPQLRPDRGRGRRGQAREVLLRQRRGRGLRQGPPVEGDFLPGVAHLRPEMLAVQVDQPLAGQRPQPDVKRHGRRGGVLREAPGHVEVGLLENVRGVEPPGHAVVEAEADHLAQPVAVVREQRPQGRRVPGPGPPQQVVGRRRRVGHGLPLRSIPGAGPR
jgi:hypothetical protein